MVTVLVILWGAFVRVTGSGAGCADHWPLCNGVLVPRSPTLATIIELTHRVTSSLAGLLSIVVFFLARRSAGKGSGLRLAAGLQLFLMLLEGAIGALLVKKGLVAKDTSEARALVVGIHLCNTFLLLAAQLATLQWARRGELRFRGTGALPYLLLGAMLLFVLLGASGAVTALGDTLFPAGSLTAGMQQDFDEQAHLLVRLRVWHPVLALMVGALIVYLAQQIRAAYDPQHTARWAALVTAGYVAQMVLGSLNLLLLAPAAIQILHLLLADLTWLALLQLGLVGLFEARAVSQPTVLAAVAARSA